MSVLEAVRATNPALIADNMPADWGMNRLRSVLAGAETPFCANRAEGQAQLRRIEKSDVICSTQGPVHSLSVPGLYHAQIFAGMDACGYRHVA